MHHSQDRDSDVIRRLREEMEKSAREHDLGPTREFPQGQLDDTDEGEIKIGVAARDGKVVLNFGGPVAWIGFDPKQARELAESLRKASYRAEGR